MRKKKSKIVEHVHRLNNWFNGAEILGISVFNIVVSLVIVHYFYLLHIWMS